MAIFTEVTENERIIDRHLHGIHPLLDYDASESKSMISIWFDLIEIGLSPLYGVMATQNWPTLQRGFSAIAELLVYHSVNVATFTPDLQGVKSPFHLINSNLYLCVLLPHIQPYQKEDFFQKMHQKGLAAKYKCLPSRFQIRMKSKFSKFRPLHQQASTAKQAAETLN